jgi:hypothetical protein
MAKAKAKSLRYTVLNHLEVEVFTSDKLERTTPIIKGMQKNDKEPKIYLRDDKDLKMVMWEKNTFEHNYIKQPVEYRLNNLDDYLTLYLADGSEILKTNNLHLIDLCVKEKLINQFPIFYLRDDNAQKAYSWTKKKSNNNYQRESIVYIAPIAPEEAQTK